MEALSRVMTRINEIQARVGATGSGFQTMLDQAVGPETERPASFFGQSTAPVTFGTMIGVGGFLPVAAPSVGSVYTSDQLDGYLTALGVRTRNGHLDATDLVSVSGQWDDRPARLLPPAARAWEEMRSAASSDGVDLRAIDTYRSWEAQAQGRQQYLTGAKDAYVAPPGESRHGEGLAVDVSNGSLVGPGDVEWDWLQANGRRFGWYPISTESWHWEFRGTGA